MIQEKRPETDVEEIKNTVDYGNGTQVLNLWQKISKVKELVGVVKKEGKVAFKNTNYNYQKAEDIELAVREACLKVGIIIIPYGFQVVSDINGIITTIQTYRVVNIETGEYIVCEMGGQGQDSGDKRIYKAETGATKYLHKQLFQIPSEADDPDLIPSEAYKVKTVDNKGNITNWKDYVPKNGKHAGERLEDIAKADLQWVKYFASKTGELADYCVAALKELE